MDNDTLKKVNDYINSLVIEYTNIYNSKEDSNIYMLQLLTDLQAFTNNEVETANNYSPSLNDSFMDQLREVFNKIRQDIYDCVNAEKPRKTDKAKYLSLIYNKLSTLFRIRGIYDEDRAIIKYLSLGVLQEEWHNFLILISDIIEESNVDFIPDKIMLLAYLQIDTITFEKMKQHNDSAMSRLCLQMEEHLISLKMNASETGARKDKATLENLKIKKFGHEVEQVKQATEIVVTPKLTNEDYSLRFANIGQLLGENKENK